jgi:1-deoxy-D-xylulose-5-phosphate reductoisomerase
MAVLVVKPRSVTVLGATGSVGRATVDLLCRNPERFTVETLTGGANAELLAEQARLLNPRFIALADPDGYAALKSACPGIEIGVGPEAVTEAARRPAEWVMASILGAAGLEPVLAAAERGALIALANKEAMVSAGALVNAAVARGGGRILPVDSEHNAIFQVLDPANIGAVERLILTASGGPFRDWPRSRMETATPAEAVRHPNWSMGAKISVDSASLMNKGLEIIEAHHLFGIPEERIEVLVHPQSVVHSLVEYADGSSLAQLGPPDMRVPILNCLSWPERIAGPAARLDLAAVGRLEFQAPDTARFPALDFARAALRRGGTAPAAFSAANEVAVGEFLAGRLGFLAIADIALQAMEADPARPADSLNTVLEADAAARDMALSLIGARKRA